ncbi:MAG: hypothetical protein LLF76_08600 [Planctomycetaceae bacterium]|nr:hypothetical protein [Planctomycetaceae bacterium]
MNHSSLHFPGWIFNNLPVLQLLLLFLLVCVLLFAAAFFVTRRLGRRKKASRLQTAPLKVGAENYDIPGLLRTIDKLKGRRQTLLLAAGSINALPVTVPVNLAIQLAKKGKCLLIDLDLNRNAAAKVFELHSAASSGAFHVSSLPTAIENLFVWPARHFETLHQMNLQVILKEAQKKYDYILLYAPYLTTLADRKHIVGCVKQAVVFGCAPGRDENRLIELLNTFNCKIVQYS